MATISTVTSIDETRIPVEGSATLRADASYVWSALPTSITTMNTAIGMMNAEIKKVNQDALQVSIDKAATLEAKNEAVLAKNEIQGYVIPTEATYSPSEIDAKVGVFSNQNTALDIRVYANENKAMINPIVFNSLTIESNGVFKLI